MSYEKEAIELLREAETKIVFFDPITQRIDNLLNRYDAAQEQPTERKPIEPLNLVSMRKNWNANGMHTLMILRINELIARANEREGDTQ